MANLRKHNAIANAIVLQYAQRMNWLLYGGIAAALGYLVFFRKEESPPIPSQPGQAGIAVGSCVAVDLTRVADNPVDLVDLITLITNNGTTTIAVRAACGKVQSLPRTPNEGAGISFASVSNDGKSVRIVTVAVPQQAIVGSCLGCDTHA
jgi:hypothetical protein